MDNDSLPDGKYPSPLKPMVGKYLVRKKYVGAGLSVIDACCSVLSAFGTDRRRRDNSAISPPIRSIVISQGGHLGDLIMSLPALRWIRQHRPEIKIGLIVGSWAKPMIGAISGLYDECYFSDHFLLNRSGQSRQKKIFSHSRSWRAVATKIRQEKYDAAIEFYSFLPNSIPMLFASSVPIRVGFTSGGFGPLLTHPVRWNHASRSLVDYPRDLLRVLFDDLSLELPFTAYYPSTVSTYRIPEGSYILLQTGTGNHLREWSDDKWKRLANELCNRNFRLVIAGVGTRESQRASMICSDVKNVIINLCDKLNWEEFSAVVAGAMHVVCLDSSTSHLAAGLRVPSTVIMPGLTDFKQFGPASSSAEVITHKTPCAPCFRSGGCSHMSCIRNVDVDSVVNSVLRRIATLQKTVVSKI